jgi:hypothetical protein
MTTEAVRAILGREIKLRRESSSSANVIVRIRVMENFFCNDLDSLTRRLKCAIERKNELIAADLFGRWMMAAEADLTRTNELLMNHHQACSVCGAHLETLLSRWSPSQTIIERTGSADQSPVHELAIDSKLTLY